MKRDKFSASFGITWVLFFTLMAAGATLSGCGDDVTQPQGSPLLGWWYRLDEQGRDRYVGFDRQGWMHLLLSFPDGTVLCQAIRYEVDGDLVHVKAPDGTSDPEDDFAFGFMDDGRLWVQPVTGLKRYQYSSVQIPQRLLDKCS